MGDQVYVLAEPISIVVEPRGSGLAAGWLPGTFVKFDPTTPTFSPSAICSVVKSDGTGTQAGFLITGPQHNVPVELQSDMWTTDSRQRVGGDNHADWSAIDAGITMSFDDMHQVERMGSRIVQMILVGNGLYKFYIFETNNKAERNVPGTGSALTYVPGDALYVSENGLLTNEKETASHSSISMVVCRSDSDDEGSYLIIGENAMV